MRGGGGLETTNLSEISLELFRQPIDTGVSLRMIRAWTAKVAVQVQRGEAPTGGREVVMQRTAYYWDVLFGRATRAFAYMHFHGRVREGQMVLQRWHEWCLRQR